jgi:hypothetical protein
MQILVMQFSPPSRHSIPLWSKYSPQHLVLKHPQFMNTASRTILKNTVFWDVTQCGSSRTEVLEERLASIIGVKNINVPGEALAVTSK